jgi:TolA-binding protein
MSLDRRRTCLLSTIGVCLFTFSLTARGGAEDTAARGRAWRDFGALLLYQRGTGSYPCAQWLGQEMSAPDPDSRQAVTDAQAVLSRALDGYGADALAIQGRIPLDVNPQCLLGLYLAERFSGTRLGDWGSRQFDRCIEQACRVALPGAGDTWGARLAAELSAAGETSGGPAATGAWAETEMPYLYLYLLRNARTTDIRNGWREHLARSLRQEYGLEPGLREYLVLLDEGGAVNSTWLEVAAQLEQTGAPGRAERVYERILRNADSREDARTAYENLAHILLRESRYGQALQAWGLLLQRFPSVECVASDIRDFVHDFQVNRVQTGRQLWSELARMTSGPQALQWCRRFEALWQPEEAPSQWQTATEKAEPGSLARQLGRVFLAGALLDAGRVDAAETLIREYTESSDPFVQARSLTVAAEIARTRGNMEQAIRQYARAVRIDRQTPLPSWYKELVQVPPAGAPTPAAELPAQRLFLKGCNLLIEGDYAGAVDSLQQAADLRQLPEAQRRALPGVTMLACLGLEDYAQAEAWGYQALEARRADHPSEARTLELLARSRSIDAIFSHLMATIRSPVIDTPAVEAALRDIVDLYMAGTNSGPSEFRAEGIDGGIVQLYMRARKRHLARVLTAEYLGAREHETQAGTKERSAALLPLFFGAQVLSEDSFERIRERFSSLGEAQDAADQMYRFAVFAQNLKRTDLAASALDAAAASASRVEVLEEIAGMYLAASHPQKAIDVYGKVSTLAKDPGRARAALLRSADLYGENLKNYDKAVQKCEEFVQKYPDSPEVSQVEFLLGKYAYLRKDYAGAVGQLDGFRRKYPEHSQVGPALMLAALSRMAEGNTPEAIGRFREIIRRYPDSDLAARSKFLTGYAQVSAQQYAAAMETFRQLIEQFPESPYVPQAQNLLERLSKVSP